MMFMPLGCNVDVGEFLKLLMICPLECGPVGVERVEQLAKDTTLGLGLPRQVPSTVCEFKALSISRD